MRKSSKNLFIHSQAKKKKKSQPVFYHQLQRCNDYIEHFYSEQHVSECHISAPPEQVSTKAELAAANEE